MTWQPIETAPKDGTEILVARAGYGMAVVSFRDGEWCNAGEWCFAGDVGWGGSMDVEPTHWMPLPEPPSGDREG